MTADEGQRLVHLSALGDPGTREAVIERHGEQVPVFVVRNNGCVRAFINRCPHREVPLNWQPDTFLTPGGKAIRCSLHGALFRVEDGLCVSGPCEGRYLTEVPVAEDGGYVVLQTTETPQHR